MNEDQLNTIGKAAETLDNLLFAYKTFTFLDAKDHLDAFVSETRTLRDELVGLYTEAGGGELNIQA